MMSAQSKCVIEAVLTMEGKGQTALLQPGVLDQMWVPKLLQQRSAEGMVVAVMACSQPEGKLRKKGDEKQGRLFAASPHQKELREKCYERQFDDGGVGDGELLGMSVDVRDMDLEWKSCYCIMMRMN
ncbi:hypothetical protein NDU88_000160 [Pleurodeles waltl]|uniref:Uncharacterized protein n=1 Tax=Pleurodeles waltl TaxID=8319 RepID=A0AAV7TEV4_PLEWA|nr:hypothetical protein NDU88_000160 [Pleurodeles waltl]